MRRRLLPPPGRVVEDDGVLARIVGSSPSPLDHMVFLARVTAESADAAIAAEVARARAGRHGVQWNVYGDDEPADLIERLARGGFRVQADETVLAMPSGDARSRFAPPAGVTVRRLAHERELTDYFAVDEAVWGTQFTEWARSWFVPALSGSAEPIGIFVAYDAGTPVGCGWATIPRGRSFAHLFGGTVLPSHRRRGV